MKNEEISLIAAWENPFDSGCHRRVFGWFKDLKRAKKAVETNECDMEECLYNYIIIEEMKPGIHCHVIKEHWYKWNVRKRKWLPILKPKKLAGIINFTIG